MCIAVEGKRLSGKAVWLILLFWIRLFVICSNGVCRVCLLTCECVCVCVRAHADVCGTIHALYGSVCMQLCIVPSQKDVIFRKKTMFLLYLIHSAGWEKLYVSQLPCAPRPLVHLNWMTPMCIPYRMDGRCTGEFLSFLPATEQPTKISTGYGCASWLQKNNC